MIGNLSVVILAGGRGTRMQSDKPKVLHEIADKPMVFYSIQNLSQIVPVENIFVVISHQAELVKETIKKEFECNFAYQKEPLGTANAFQAALEVIPDEFKAVLVVNGDDSAFYSKTTLKKLINSHLDTNSTVSVVTLDKDNETRLGKIFRDQEGNFLQILEPHEYINLNLESKETNCGAYIFNLNWAKEKISEVEKNEKGEYPITDLPNRAKLENLKVNIFKLQSAREWVGVNTQDDLKKANEKMQKRSRIKTQ